MKIRIRLVVLLLAIAWVPTANAADRTVVVTLFDGFSPAMADATQTPNLDRMKREGAWSRHLVPAFPTLSMTNHTTYATGCWPAHHGIISNTFYDKSLGRYGGPGHTALNIGDADWHTGCESIWEAAERQGVHAAVFNWVGRWSSKRGKLATFANPLVPHGDGISDEDVLAQGLKALRNNSPNHPRLIALYFRGPDEAAHYHGVTAPETLAAVRNSDAIVGKLMAAISALPKNREATLIVGTDHGMIDVGPLVNVGRLMNKYDIKAKQASDGATTFLYLDKGESADRVAAALAPYKFAFDVYKKGHYPAYAHLGDGYRSGDLMLVAHPPYWMVGPELFPAWTRLLGLTWFWDTIFVPPFGGLKATHGYAPAVVQMHGIFYAWGSDIAKGKQIPRLDMIDIHPTVMALLGLKPGHPVDGHIVQAMLAH
ncbi:MAG: ectonucleotide pyrophosphatase/phosphodiesterase [Rhizomicrobium sp.]